MGLSKAIIATARKFLGINSSGRQRIIGDTLMATEVANFSAASVRSYATQSLEKIALDTKIFVSMPYIGNLFLALRGREWEDDPSRVTILTPSVNNCIEGITRDW